MVKTRKKSKMRLRKTSKRGGAKKTGNDTIKYLEETNLPAQTHQKMVEIAQALNIVSLNDINKKNISKLEIIANKFIVSSDTPIKEAATSLLNSVNSFKHKEEEEAIKLAQQEKNKEQAAITPFLISNAHYKCVEITI